MNELNQNEQLINDMITEQQPASAVKLVNPVIDADQASPVREAASSTNAIRGEPGILRQQTNKAGANNKLLKSQKSVNFITEENNFTKAAKDQASEKKEARSPRQTRDADQAKAVSRLERILDEIMRLHQ